MGHQRVEEGEGHVICHMPPHHQRRLPDGLKTVVGCRALYRLLAHPPRGVKRYFPIVEKLYFLRRYFQNHAAGDFPTAVVLFLH
jgi:hypothetical protein